MHRRRYLAVAAGALAGLAGCGATPPATTTAEPTATRPPTAEAAPGLEVSIDTAAYLVHSFAQDQEKRAIERDEIVPLGDVDEPLRSALEAAVEGGYSTADVGDELLAGIDRFRVRGRGDQLRLYVNVDGTPFAFDPTVPVFVATLEEVEDPDPDRTLDQDEVREFDEPVREFIHTIAAFGTHDARVEYRASAVPPSVEAFLERDYYVRDAVGTGRVVTERVDPGPPYTITASRLTADDIWGRPVLQPESLPADLRAFVETVVASDRRTLVHPHTRTEYRTDDLPPGYEEHLGPAQGPGSGPYVELDGTMYAIRVTDLRREHVPIEVSAAPAGGAAFEVTVAPSEAGQKPAILGPVELKATLAVPGPLWVVAGDDRHRLDRVETVISGPGDDGTTPVGDEETVAVPAEGALTATYRVPSDVGPGTYRAWGLVRASWVDADTNRPSPTWPYPFQVVLTVPET